MSTSDLFTMHTKFGELQALPGIAPFKDMILRGNYWKHDILPQVTPEFFPGKGEDILFGLRRLKELGDRGVRPIKLYEAPYEDPRMEDVNIIPFVVPEGKDKPYAIVIPGGSFITTFSITEGFPIAAKLNALGYSAFVLSYQIGGVSLMPRPMDDIAVALRRIDENAEEFGVTPGSYFTAGFSAGANICALWGTKQVGYAKHGVPKPKALFVIYGAINYRKVKPLPGGSTSDGQRVRFGVLPDGTVLEGVTQEPYYADELADGDYPPTYISGCLDDNLVNPLHWYIYQEALRKQGVPVLLETGETGGHGYGLGRNTDMAGWPEHALEFMNRQEAAL